MAMIAVLLLAFLAADPISSLEQSPDPVSSLGQSPDPASDNDLSPSSAPSAGLSPSSTLSAGLSPSSTLSAGLSPDTASDIGLLQSPMSSLEQQTNPPGVPACGKQADLGGSIDLSCDAQCKVVDRRTAYAGCTVNGMRGYRIVFIYKVRCTNPCTGESWEYRVEDPGECILIRVET